MGVCNCSMFCCTLLCVHSSIAIIFVGKRELVALLNLSSWCLVMVERLFLAVPRGCLRFVILVFPDHTHFFYHSLPKPFYNILHQFISVYCCDFTIYKQECEGCVLARSVCESHTNRHRYRCLWNCTPVCPLYVCLCK